jgi:transcriptional regulator with XRE-family HTH domain
MTEEPNSDAASQNATGKCDGFSKRLKVAMGGESTNSFARKCDLRESTIRGYLSGSTPSLDKALAMSKAAGVSLAWLASGEGPIRADSPTAQAGNAGPLDLEALELAIAVLEEALHRNGLKMRPAEKAALAASNYDLLRLTSDRESISVQLRQILDSTLSRSWKDE